MRRALKLRALWLARALGLFWLARRVTRSKLRILCYHGFERTDETRFRSKLFITARTFTERLQTIERMGFRVTRLGAAVEGLYAGILPDNSVVITIDDGFESVAEIAAPLLREHGFPATVYITTYYVVNRNPVFRLAVQYMFWKTSKERVSLGPLLCAAARDVVLGDKAAAAAAAWECIEHGEKRCDENGRQAILSELGDRLGVPYGPLKASGILSLLSLDRIAALAADGLDVQLHTHRHRFPEDEHQAKRELEDNRRVLAQVVSQPLEHFCYPSGLWSPCQAAWLDELGIRSSTTCTAGLNDACVPRYALRRFLDGENVDALEFEAELSGFGSAVRWVRGLANGRRVDCG